MRRIAIALALVAGAACSSDLPPANVVSTVRILATKADLPYAKPGETVTLEVLAADGRPDRSRAMRVFWLPDLCVNPPGDDYFGCYPSMRGRFPAGSDLSSVLPQGAQQAFPMPADVIAHANPHPGAATPYGLAFAFVMACAGHVEYRPVDAGSSPLTTPFACYDDANVPLSPDDFVFAFTRVYAFENQRNANPVIDHLSVAGTTVGAAGVTLDHCTGSDESHCSKSEVDTVVPESSWELDPGALAPPGHSAREAIWVDYYVTGGRFDDDSEVLFDPVGGKVSRSGDDYAPPLSAGPQTLWAVVHDTRGGTSWVSVPMNVK